MTDPTQVTCTANAWTKVLTNVQDGMVFIVDTDPSYMFTTVATGAAAPTDLTTAALLPSPGLPVSSSVPVDVYVFCVNDGGKVRVSAP